MKTLDFDKELKLLKISLERQKRARLQGKVITNYDQEQIEFERMVANLQEIEKKIKSKKNNEANPIAAAFVHKLAEFVKANTNKKIEEEVKTTAGGYLTANSNIEKKLTTGSGSRSGGGQALDLSPSMQRLKRENYQKEEMIRKAPGLHITSNDLVKNLQSKFTVTTRDNKDVVGIEDQKIQDDFKFDSDMMSVRLAGSETGSITGESRTLESHLRALRSARYEHYEPPSIRNLKYSAHFVMAVLVAMTIANFLFSQDKYA